MIKSPSEHLERGSHRKLIWIQGINSNYTVNVDFLLKSTGVFGVNKEHIVSSSFRCHSYGTWELETHWKATLNWGVSQGYWTETFFVYIKPWIIFFPLTQYTLILDKIWESFFLSPSNSHTSLYTGKKLWKPGNMGSHPNWKRFFSLCISRKL